MLLHYFERKAKSFRKTGEITAYQAGDKCLQGGKFFSLPYSRRYPDTNGVQDEFTLIKCVKTFVFLALWKKEGGCRRLV